MTLVIRVSERLVRMAEDIRNGLIILRDEGEIKATTLNNLTNLKQILNECLSIINQILEEGR